MTNIYEKLVFALFFFLSCAVFSQTTAIPDAAFEQQLINFGYDSNGLNGTILNAEAEAVTEIVTNGDNIASFEGLQAFVNITKINLGRNQFTTLPLENLTALEELIFTDNEVLAALDLTTNVNLKILNIRSVAAINRSSMATLDLSKNTRLESIEIFNFQDLETILLPQTKNLREFKLVSNFDFTADMSFYDNLEILELQISGNISILDLPNVTTNLKKLQIIGGNLSDFRSLVDYVNLNEIKLLGPTEFIQFPVTNTLERIIIEPHFFSTPISFDGIPQLNYLHIKSNRTTVPLEIDIRSNSELQTIILGQNNMVDLNLQGNTNLLQLQIQENNLETLDVTKNIVLEDLRAQRNLLSSIDLRNNKEIFNLVLFENRLSSLDLTGNQLLKNVDISKNLLAGEGPDLSQNSELEILDMSNNKIASLDITGNLKMTEVNLSFNELSGNNILEQIVQNYQMAGRSLGAETYTLNDNLLSNTLPNFTSLVDGSTSNFSLSIHNNSFHFGDLEARHQQYVNYTTTPNGGGFIFKTYSYAGQSKVNVREVITTLADEPITLTTVVRGTQNNYKWFKDGVEIIGAANAPEYTIPAPEACESGVYFAEITSGLMPFEDANAAGTNGKNLVLQRNDIILGANGVPACAIIVNPLNKAIDIPINAGVAWESESGACGFLLTVGTTSGANDILDEVDVGNVSGYNFENNLPADSEIFVTITPYFENGPLLGCREESFTTNSESTLPECSVLTQPLTGSVGVKPDTNINWSNASGAEGYRIQIGTTSGGSDLATENLDGSITSYDPAIDFLLNTEIFVTITPFNAEGDALGCAESNFFVSDPGQAPPCTSLSTPINEDIDVRINTLIRWNSVGNANGYVLNIGTTAFGSEILSRDVGSEIEFQLDNDLPASETIYVTIVPYNTIGEANACVSESFITADILPLPDCTTLMNPINGERDVDPSIDLAWNIAENAEGYRLEVGTTPEGDEFFSEDIGITTFYNFRTDLPEGRPIYVRIIPYNETGDAIACERESFVTNVPTIPDCTTLALPENEDVNVSVATNFAWNSVSTAKGYTLTIGSFSGGNDILSEDVGATTFYDLTDSLPEEQTIFVTVIPYNDSGEAIACVEESFTTAGEIVLPECTSLTMPISGPMAVPINTSIAWNAIANAEGYKIQVGSTSGAFDLFSQDVGSTNAISLPEDLPENSTIYVLITPYNALGDALSCSEETFTTAAAPAIPACTNLTMPVNEATTVSMATNFAWLSVQNADGYVLNIGTASGTTDIFSEDIGLTNFYDLAQDLPPSMPIYVSILPYNAEGFSMGCLEDSFTTAAAPTIPSCTSLSLPLNGDEEVNTFTNFAWNLVANALGYTVQIGTSSGGAEIFSGDVGSTTWFDLANELPESTEIYVTIGAYNDLGEAQSCQEERFITADRPTVPSCSILIAPVEGARAVDPNTSIVWNAVSDANGYRFSVGTVAGGTDIIDNQDVGLLTEFSFVENLPPAAQIYVTVKPYNEFGENVLCTSQSFTTAFTSEEIVPFCTSLYEPIDGQSNVQTTTTLSWNEVTNTAGYVLSIGTASSARDILDDFDVGLTTSYTVEELPVGTLIYVTIKPYNAQGSQEGCPETKFITTFVEPPTDDTAFGFSPNSDGINDFWVIDGIQNHPDNIVTIYNRWGEAIFKTTGYDNFTNVFNGTANQKSTIGAGKLPAGTYFFTINVDGPHDLKKTKGYLVLKR